MSVMAKRQRWGTFVSLITFSILQFGYNFESFTSLPYPKDFEVASILKYNIIIIYFLSTLAIYKPLTLLKNVLKNYKFKVITLKILSCNNKVRSLFNLI